MDVENEGGERVGGEGKGGGVKRWSRGGGGGEGIVEWGGKGRTGGSEEWGEGRREGRRGGINNLTASALLAGGLDLGLLES